MTRTDVLLLSLGTTTGLRIGDQALAELVRTAGASVEVAQVRLGVTAALRRAQPAIDLVEAVAARRALSSAMARVRPAAVIFSSTTSSLLAGEAGVPYAVRLDAPAKLNRPGARNALQHALERRRLREARVVLPFGRLAADALPAGAAPAVVVPQPILPSGPVDGPREPLVVAYTPDPKAKGLDIVAAAWARAGLADAQPEGAEGAKPEGTQPEGAQPEGTQPEGTQPEGTQPQGARLEVFGIEPELGRRHLARSRIAEPPGLIWRGRVPPDQFRAALRTARVFVTGARWEDYGFAQLEALADGALLVCAATGGPFEALTHARELGPELCAPSLDPLALADALRRAFALSEPEVQRYRRAAAKRMAVHRPEGIQALIAERVLPALLG